jgi:hypothetical protein
MLTASAATDGNAMPYTAARFSLSLSAPAHPNPNHDEDQQRSADATAISSAVICTRSATKIKIDQRAAVIRA